jgi:hypothetical protein
VERGGKEGVTKIVTAFSPKSSVSLFVTPVPLSDSNSNSTRGARRRTYFDFGGLGKWMATGCVDVVAPVIVNRARTGLYLDLDSDHRPVRDGLPVL